MYTRLFSPFSYVRNLCLVSLTFCLVDIVELRAQTPTNRLPLGARRATLDVLGGLTVDSMLRLPKRPVNDTSATSSRLRTKGALFYDSTNARVLVYDGTRFKEIGGAGTNIYNSDGRLTGPRKLTLGASNLDVLNDSTGSWGRVRFFPQGGNGRVSIGTDSAEGRLHVRGGSIVMDAQKFQLRSLGALTGAIGATDSLLVIDTGNVVKKISPASVRAASDSSIYNSDGTLTGARAVTMNNNNLTFIGASGKVGIGTTAFTPVSKFEVKGAVRTDSLIITDTTRGNVATDSLLVIDNQNRVKRISPASVRAASDSSIYNSDGTLTGARAVTMEANNLTFNATTGNFIYNPTGEGKMGIGTASPISKLHVQGAVRTDSLIITDTTRGNVATDSLLVIDNQNRVKRISPASVRAASDSSIYNSDGTLTAERTITLGAFNLNVNNNTSGSWGRVRFFPQGGNGQVSIGTDSAQGRLHVRGGSIVMDAPAFQLRSLQARRDTIAGDSLLVVGTDNIVRKLSTRLPNIYNSDGTLTANRTITLGGKTLRVVNNGTNNYLKIEAGGTMTNRGGIHLTERNNNWGWKIRNNAQNDNLEFAMTTDTTEGDNKMVIARNGAVGIATESPNGQYALQVAKTTALDSLNILGLQETTNIDWVRRTLVVDDSNRVRRSAMHFVQGQNATGGNAFGDTARLGTYDTMPMRFYAASTPALTLEPGEFTRFEPLDRTPQELKRLSGVSMTATFQGTTSTSPSVIRQYVKETGSASSIVDGNSGTSFSADAYVNFTSGGVKIWGNLTIQLNEMYYIDSVVIEQGGPGGVLHTKMQITGQQSFTKDTLTNTRSSGSVSVGTNGTFGNRITFQKEISGNSANKSGFYAPGASTNTRWLRIREVRIYGRRARRVAESVLTHVHHTLKVERSIEVVGTGAPLSAPNGVNTYFSSTNTDTAAVKYGADSTELSGVIDTTSNQVYHKVPYALRQGREPASDLRLVVNGSGLFKGAVYVASDERIKKVQSPVSAREALAKIAQIRVLDYSYRDPLVYGSHTRRGLLAQELEKVLPEAVTISDKKEIVPDIFKMAERVVAQGDYMDITLSAHTLREGDTIRVLAKGAELVRVEAVPSADKFRIRKIALDARMPSVFVYGRQVRDFRTVNYDYVMMTNIAATQALQTAYEADKKRRDEEVATLKKQLAELKNILQRGTK